MAPNQVEHSTKETATMDQIKIHYSTKNIPCPSEGAYKRKLIEKTEKLIRRMRWRAFFFLHPEAKTENKETFGFNSRQTPPIIDEMTTFEKRMTNIIQDSELRKSTNKFQNDLKDDLQKIKEDEHIIVKADKTTNYYKMQKEEYKSLLEKNVQKEYKISTAAKIDSMNSQAKHLASEIRLQDRIEVTAKREAFITLKDHKPNFENKPTCRLINPAKSELGRVSKEILERIIRKTAAETNVNLWRSTMDVLQWFNNTETSSKSTFITFDIINFYPSINEKLLLNAVEFADKFDLISPIEKEIILHTKKSLLFSNQEAWEKKGGENGAFDVTMGSYDGAETCELVTTFLLHQMKEKIGENIGLYRDDGLAVINGTPRTVENIKKEICKIFSENNLKITIEANKKIVNFLDVTLNIAKQEHSPYMKPDNTPLYVNTKSNHPPSVLKAIPQGINKRLETISSNEIIFNKAKAPYQEALQKSGYDHTLEYNQTTIKPSSGEKKKRKRKVIWFNPPYDMRLEKPIGREFLKAVAECFHQGHPLRKIFNKSTVKLSYSCMPNVKTIIDGMNREKLGKQEASNHRSTMPCNCRNKKECPLNGGCRVKEVVYQATVEAAGERETYVGVTENEFKTRLANHKQTFKNQTLENSTELSKHIWKLKRNEQQFEVTWRILGRARAYSNATKRCNLCNLEKFYIICKKEMSTLNKRLELVTICRHSKKYLLGSAGIDNG